MGSVGERSPGCFLGFTLAIPTPQRYYTTRVIGHRYFIGTEEQQFHKMSQRGREVTVLLAILNLAQLNLHLVPDIAYFCTER